MSKGENVKHGSGKCSRWEEGLDAVEGFTSAWRNETRNCFYRSRLERLVSSRGTM